jgi:hypothetical protein
MVALHAGVVRSLGSAKIKALTTQPLAGAVDDLIASVGIKLSKSFEQPVEIGSLSPGGIQRCGRLGVVRRAFVFRNKEKDTQRNGGRTRE